jgi:hypothetical protein
MRNWTGAVNTTEMLTEPTPPALVDTLLAAIEWPVTVALTQCQPALCYDGNSTGLTTRHFALMAPVGVLAGRAWITRCGDDVDGAQQVASTIENTTSVDPNGVGDGTAAAEDIITVPGPVLGSSQYLDIASTPGAVVIVQTGDTNEPSPPAPDSIDRMLELNEALASQLEEFSVLWSAGFGLQVAIRTGDLSTL